jgi:hypothetical protein
VAIANPYGAPVVRTHRSSTGGAEAIAWPAGQHPVIVTWADVRFCDTDLCDRYTSQSGGPAVWDGYGTAGIGPDGTVVKASISSGGQNGGPFAHYARCTRDGCPEAWLPVRADAREEYDAEGGHVELAVNAAPDGSLWFFVAMPIPAAGKKAGTESDTEPNGRYRLKLIRCPDPTCKTPEYHDAGTIDRTPGDGYQDGRRARLSLSPDGRPLASLWIGWSVEQVTCDPATCGNLRRVHAEAGPPSAVWATPAVAGRPVASLEGGLLRSGGGETFQFSQTSGTAGAVVTDGDLVYLTGAVPAERPPGNLTFRITLGTPPEYRRQTLWRCAGGDCHGTPLDVYEGPAQRQMLVPGPDGRVLIVRADRTLLVESL